MPKEGTEIRVERGEPPGGSTSGGGDSRQDSGGEQGEAERSRAHEGKEGGKQKESGKEEPSRVEWVVGIICSVVVLVAVGYLFYEALSGPSQPPLVTIEVEQVRPAGQGYLVELRIVNEGGETAANLMIEGSLMQDTVTVEKSTATIAFVPAETERRGGLFFTRDPGRYRLEVRPTGYDRP